MVYDFWPPILRHSLKLFIMTGTIFVVAVFLVRCRLSAHRPDKGKTLKNFLADWYCKLVLPTKKYPYLCASIKHCYVEATKKEKFSSKE